MAKLIYAAGETSSANSDGSTVAMYFEGTPTKDEIKRAAKNTADFRYPSGEVTCPLGADVSDEFFEGVEVETPVSKAAGLVRVEVYPCG